MLAAPQLSQDELKQMVGYKSVDDYVESGMVVGLGTGSTAYFAVERLGQKLKSGEARSIARSHRAPTYIEYSSNPLDVFWPKLVAKS